jgi:hypothetical protein
MVQDTRMLKHVQVVTSMTLRIAFPAGENVAGRQVEHGELVQTLGWLPCGNIDHDELVYVFIR